VPGRSAPYDTYVSAAAGWGLDPTATTPPAALFTYSDTAPAGSPVSSVHIPFASTNDTIWTWDAKSRQWLLSYGGTPATVSSGSQIATANIVIETVKKSEDGDDLLVKGPVVLRRGGPFVGQRRVFVEPGTGKSPLLRDHPG
jgi:hypothetical protein